MKVFENIKKLGSSKDFERIVRDLLPLRNSESKTYEYIESFLHSDKRFKLWKEDRREAEVNGVLGLNPELQEFVLREGEVDPDDAPEIRKALLQLIKDDKVSFAYLYYILGSEQNRIARYTIYNCIPPSEEAIDYAIRFDLDTLDEEAEKIDSLNERFNYVMKKEQESKKHAYEGEPKDRFEKYCEELKKGIKETISLQNALRNSEESKDVPKDIVNLFGTIDKYKNFIMEVKKSSTAPNIAKAYFCYGRKTPYIKNLGDPEDTEGEYIVPMLYKHLADLNLYNKSQRNLSHSFREQIIKSRETS